MRCSSVLTIAAVSCLLFGVAAMRLSSRFSSALAAQPQSAAQAQTAEPQGPQLQPASATFSPAAKPADIPSLKSSSLSPQPALQPLHLSLEPASPLPATEIYTAKRGESILTIAHQYLKRTGYLTSSELADAIRHINGDRSSNILKAGEQITIPGILPAPIVEKTVPVAKDFEVRAVYLTGVMAASDHGVRIIRHWREVGGNAVVFDIKDSDGSVNIPFEHPLLGQHKVYIHDLPKFIHFLHSQNMHAIARIAIFRDERMVVEHPELAVRSKKTGQPWLENGKLVWTDPSQPKVQEFDIALAKFVAQSGADEIQFDYVRFPAEGDQKDASFFFQAERPDATQSQDSASAKDIADQGCAASVSSGPAPKGQKNAAHGASRGLDDKSQPAPEGRKTGCSAANHTLQRSDIITAFLKKAYAEIHPTGALFSLDVFGVMAWQRPVDLSHTGQDIVGMAKYCDVLSPMIYPSHFFGMDKIEHPGDAPEHFIAESMARFQLITKGSGVVIRPWLQAFHWRTKTYSPEYIKVQVATAKEKGGIGFLFWNAANDYSKPYAAMPEMRAAKDKFFRGDELPGVAVKASLMPAAGSVPSPAETASH